jgi:hypothetical protein
VAVVVVDQLEVVEVDQQQTEAVTMALGAADLVGTQPQKTRWLNRSVSGSRVA